jgi:hypothetical protein
MKDKEEILNKIYVFKYQMPIYEAEFLGDPTPIRPTKKARKSKGKETMAGTKSGSSSTTVDTTPATPPTSPTKIDKPTPAPVTKQRKRKTVAPVVPPSPPVEKVEEEKVEEEVKPPVTKKPRKQKSKALPVAPKVIIDGKGADDPPSWFKNYLLDEAKRRNEDKEKKSRVPMSEVKKDAHEKAQVKWNDGLTRDRVTNEVNSHMNRLYSQIHGRR